MEIRPPELPEPLRETPDGKAAIRAALDAGEDCEGLLLRQQTLALEAGTPTRLELRGCRLEGCTLAAAPGLLLDFVDVELLRCDLSNLNLYKGSLQRVRLRDCKLLGASFAEASLQNVAMEACVLRYANFTGSRLQRVRLTGCDLTHGALENCRLKDFALDDCDLTAVECSFTALKGVDLRSCVLSGLAAGAGDLRGAIIGVEQAVDLVRLLGVEVR